jgi:hypothetical protein
MDRDALLRVASAHRTLAEAVAWGLAQSPACLVADVVTQDEFTLDVLVPVGELWIVYDTT